MRTTWNKEQLIEAVKNSLNYTQVAKALALKNLGSNIRTIKKYISIFQIDISHFLTAKEQCAVARSKKKSLTYDKIFIKESSVDRGYAKQWIITNNLLEYKCDDCKITSYNNKPIVLHLDHINGINNDHRLENLRFLCPNCHSQTPTYCRGEIKPKNLCPHCQTEILKESFRCNDCEKKYRKKKFKTTWLPKQKLIDLVSSHGFEYVGRLLNVSGNAVKKHIKNN